MDERLNVYEEKMSKTLDNLNGELATIRAGTDRRLLRISYTDPAGCKCIGSGGSDDPDSAMGKEYAQRDRESDHDI